MLKRLKKIFLYFLTLYCIHFVVLNFYHSNPDLIIESLELERGCFIPNYTHNNILAMTFLNQSYEANRLYFGACLLDEKDNFELDTFLEVIQTTENNKEKYKVHVRTDLIEDSLRSKFPSIRISHCILQGIWKTPNGSEYMRPSDWVKGKPLKLESTENNNTLTLNIAGDFHLKCFVAKNHKTVVQAVYTIMPLNMTLAKVRNNDKDKIRAIMEPFKDHPLVKDSEFNTHCASQSRQARKQRMNVLMIGIDSTSYNNMQRAFPLTYKYLTDLENNAIFDNLNSVGENTFPNHMAMLCGLLESNNFNSDDFNHLYGLVDNQTFHDHFPFIWKEYEKLGYVSMFHLDNPKISMFHWGKQGFLYEPVDYYNRAFTTKLEYLRRKKQLCYLKKPMYRLHFDRIEEFVTRMNSPINKETPYFSLTFQAEFTHDTLAPPPGMDKRLSDLIEKLHSKGFLNDTLLIVYGDHGHRLSPFAAYSKLGRYERSRPFFSIRLPDQLVNSVYMKNVQNNRHRLTSFFDVYQTLRHYQFLNTFKKLDLSGDECRQQFRINSREVRNNRGVSLFEEIDESRTCNEALIDDKFCRCYRQVALTESEFRATTGFQFQEVINLILNRLNDMFDGQADLCDLYRFRDLNSLTVTRMNGMVVYETIIETDPGKALFEVSFKVDTVANQLKLRESPVRINKYGSQSLCIENPFNKNYCFCRNNTQIS